jgi:hypothetical protein
MDTLLWKQILPQAMRSRILPLLLLWITLALVTFPASAHAPLGAGENGDIAHATPIPDPLKSYVVYGHIHEAGEAAWFRMEMDRGDRLVLAVNINRAGATVPDLIVAGPGIEPSGTVPPAIVLPAGNNARRIRGTPPEKGEYEPFSPSVIYETASYETVIREPGTYYAAVLATGGETDYSFVVGYKEQFTAAEWLFIPFSLIGIYLWEGQPAWAVAAPYLIVILTGLGILLWQQGRKGKTRVAREWVATIAGLLYLGTGASTICQMIWCLSFTGYTSLSIVTLVFAIIPVLLGIWILRVGRPGLPDTRRSRASLALAGVLGFVAWAGLLLGPALALLAAILPGGPGRKGTG